MMPYKAIVSWRNGSGILSDVCFKFLSEEEFETPEQAQNEAGKLFPEWREQMPESDGWRSIAWPDIEEV